MRFAAAIALALSLSPAHAEGDKDFYTFAKPGGQTLQAAPARVDPVQLYVEANVTETLYHELAHALIDLLAEKLAPALMPAAGAKTPD